MEHRVPLWKVYWQLGWSTWLKKPILPWCTVIFSLLPFITMHWAEMYTWGLMQYVNTHQSPNGCCRSPQAEPRKINMERPAADLLISPTLFTLSNALVTNESLRKLPQVNRDFKNPVLMFLFPGNWKLKSPLPKHINTVCVWERGEKSRLFVSSMNYPTLIHNKTLNIHSLPLRKFERHYNNSCNPKPSNRSGNFSV